ncbi:MAG: phasin family protein [Betaproteobacteria bacterium]|nr:MAG: phasin family protein [Betaproteobacteria bacterium]
MANPDLPFMDVNQLLAQFKIPGVDVSALMEARRKDIEALVTAHRQAEMFKEAMTEWQAATEAMMSGQSPGAGAAKQAELGKQTFEKALANMRELAEIATKSQTEAWEVVTRRFHENLEELKKLMHPE